MDATTGNTFERTWRSASGESKAQLVLNPDGTGNLWVTGAWSRGGRTWFQVTGPEAVAEFRRYAAQDSGDFDGEASFAEWFQYVFIKRPDVRMRV